MDYAESYDLLIKYNGHEETIAYVVVNMYSYLTLLAKVCKVLHLESQFIDIRAGNGFTIENDVDLMLIFELYKENHKIPLHITTKDGVIRSDVHYMRRGKGMSIPLRGGSRMGSYNGRGEGTGMGVGTGRGVVTSNGMDTSRDEGTGRGEESDEDDDWPNNIEVEFVESQRNDSDGEKIDENHSK
ncbi:hypothetical protein GH714_033845 [Hevea brasiliensis]|uniref:Uncharacterized protein n=1 Tax=Hevea brasiliensis TaxID=3981 RepID=A0A6A6KFD3_HEVBR|nr:hypothetical protein GH714_033845 [Hevea brasiliensis]